MILIGVIGTGMVHGVLALCQHQRMDMPVVLE